MHGIEEGLLDKGCAEASDLLYLEASHLRCTSSGDIRCKGSSI